MQINTDGQATQFLAQVPACPYMNGRVGFVGTNHCVSPAFVCHCDERSEEAIYMLEWHGICCGNGVCFNKA